MFWKPSRRSLIASVLTLIGMAAFTAATRSEIYFFRAKPPVTRCLRDRNFVQVTQHVVDSIIAVASVDQTSPDQEEPQAEEGGESGSASEQSEPRRKQFFVERNTLRVQHVTLENLSLAAYDDGRLVATGQINHDGGPNGALLGGNVTIRVRVYAGVPQFRGSLNNVPLLLETEKALWVQANRPQSISLLPDPGEQTSRRGRPIRDFSLKAEETPKLLKRVAEEFATAASVRDAAGEPAPTGSGGDLSQDLSQLREAIRQDIETNRSVSRLQQAIKGEFKQLTHIEVVLEYQSDR